jgi:RNase H-fold protein (predicted Holliday junction resolvase)
MWDERYSTSRAEEILQRPGQPADRAGLDAVAAAVFLQEFLDSQAEEGEKRI